MAGRNCKICSNVKLAKRCGELIAEGLSDRAIAEALGLVKPGGAGRMCVQRHRTAHVAAPARAILEAANRGRDAADQRQQLVAKAQAGELDAVDRFLALDQITADLRKTQERLERVADAAEQGGQNAAVAALSAQQLRAMEVRSKLGSVGGYAPPQKGGDGEAMTFTVNFHFGGGRVETISTVVGGPVLDHSPEDYEDAPPEGV
jgi:hypothetical protein